MAVGEKRNTNQISQVSWVDWTAMDVYYWMDHSFQYSSNINCDDELHWLKLSTKAYFTSHYAGCHLTSLWENWVAALDVRGNAMPRYFDQYTFFSGWSAWDKEPKPDTSFDVTPWTVFQDHFWYCITNNDKVAFKAVNVADIHSWWVSTPQDHPEATDESIETPNPTGEYMSGYATAILNYNNTRLVVAVWGWHSGSSIWVYYPELDTTNHSWTTWWKKVLTYEAWVTVVGLTCSFEYLKVRAVDEWWNTKVYYYQGNNNLRNTFVYNLVDLTGVRVLRVYSINWIDYYVSSIDWTDWFVNLYKLVWTTPVQLFKQRAWLDPLDVNTKAPYFVWPVWLNAAYNNGKFYIADAYGLFQFTYNPQWFDKGYMKWGLYNNRQVYWVCENQWYLYVSTEDGCYIMRVIDTWKPVPESKNSQTWEITYKSEWYQPQWVLISREFEWKEWWTFTKMLDEIRLNYELNPLTNENWEIDIYVSPNNLWLTTKMFDKWTVEELDDLPSADSCIAWDYYWVEEDKTYYIIRTVRENWTDHNEWWDVWDVIPWYKTVAWWFKVMHIDQTNGKTRTEKSNLFNDLWAWKESSFKFDWQTITYAIVITRWEETHATPIVRQIDLRYHTKDKTNNVYDIN